MERKIINELNKWHQDSKKPLLLYGIRQIGKTHSVLEYGKMKFKNTAYFNTSNNEELKEIFEKENVVDKIILKLSILSNETIFKEDTLLVFDNCNDIDLIKKFKIFSNEDPYSVIIISSKKDILNKIKGEDFRYLQMFPMDFEEFLLNKDKRQLLDFIKDSYLTMKPMPFHQMAMEEYDEYLITGGFPEVVHAHLNGYDTVYLEGIKTKIEDIFISDLCRNSDINNVSRTFDVINSLPFQLQKDNRKFQYGLIKKGGRSKEYENSINDLSLNSVVNRCYRLEDIVSPLSSHKDLESFKLYVNDAGILFSLLHLNKVRLMVDYKVRRAIIENNIANVLANLGYSLYYYQSDGKALINFVIQNRLGKIIPIEVVNMSLVKAKSLSLFLSKYNITEAIRLTEENFSKRKEIKYIPVYAAFCLKDL